MDHSNPTIIDIKIKRVATYYKKNKFLTSKNIINFIFPIFTQNHCTWLDKQQMDFHYLNS